MKDRKTLLYLLILSTFFLSMMALLASAKTEVGTRARSSALYNPDTKSFLYQSNANLRLPMASTTKIVTALVAIESLDMDEIITVPKDAVGIEGSSLYLKENDKITVRDLIYSVLLQSANDAATVLALRISGSISAFAERMNERVQSIGVTDTNFENPHGLDSKDHYTTAHDLSLIAAEALSNDTFRRISSTYKHSFKIGDEIRIVVNHNKLLKSYDGCNGVKTGYTRKSGRCLVSSAEKDGVTLVAVTLNDPDDWNDHKSMLDYGFDRLGSIDLKAEIDIPSDISTISSDGAKVPLMLAQSKIIKRIDEEFSYTVSLPSYVTTDVRMGDKIGEITVKIGNREEKIDIVAGCDVKIKKTKRRFLNMGEFNDGKNQTSEIYG